MASDVVRRYTVDYRTSGDGAAQTERMKNAVIGLGLELSTVRGEIKGFRADLDGLKSQPAALQRIATAAGQVGLNARTAAGQVKDFTAAAGAVGQTAPGFASLKAAVQATQRQMYGLKMNTLEAGTAFTTLATKAAGASASLGTMGGGLKGILPSLGTAGTSSGLLGSNLMKAAGAFAGFVAGKKIIGEIGAAIAEARDRAIELAEKALKTRDALRELANLKGKSGPDDEVVASVLRTRVDAGMKAGEAQRFQEQFLGSLPLAKDKGGITDAVAEPMSRKIAAMAVRTGLDAGTAGDLAGVMGSFKPVKSANAGLGQAQQIVDLLNDGRGNLSPLTKELLKNAAGTVGEGNSFGTLQERAAAVSVSTGLGSVGQASTRINQTIRALGRYGDEKGAGPTLREAGISGKDDFLSRVDKIAPLVEGAKARGITPDDALKEAGFDVEVERRGIIGFVANRGVLRKRIESVREQDGGDGKANAAGIRSERLNAAFLGSDKAARDRVAQARLDTAEFNRGKEGEDLQIARREAEARLLDRKEVDTTWSNVGDRVRGVFGLRQFLGGQSGREARIDSEVVNEARKSNWGAVLGDAQAGAKQIAAERARQFGQMPAGVKAGVVQAPPVQAPMVAPGRVVVPNAAGILPPNGVLADPGGPGGKPAGNGGPVGGAAVLRVLEDIKKAIEGGNRNAAVGGMLGIDGGREVQAWR